MLIGVLKYARKLALAASPSYTNTVKCKCFSVVSCGEKKKKKAGVGGNCGVGCLTQVDPWYGTNRS